MLGAARVDLAVAQGDLTATKAFLARVEANKFTTTTAAAADGIAETTNVDQSTGVTAPHATATKTVANSNGTINATSTSVDVSDGDVTTKLVAELNNSQLPHRPRLYHKRMKNSHRV